jgi:hypothetical protein
MAMSAAPPPGSLSAIAGDQAPITACVPHYDTAEQDMFPGLHADLDAAMTSPSTRACGNALLIWVAVCW